MNEGIEISSSEEAGSAATRSANAPQLPTKEPVGSLRGSGNGGPPPLVICAGLSGSASTWLFNIVAEIISLYANSRPVVRIYLDTSTQEDRFLQQEGLFVVKTHCPPPWVFSLATVAQVPIFVSIRDPRDSAASLMTRFGEGFEDVLYLVRVCCQALEPLSGRGNVHTLRYEDGFAERPETLERIAAHIGVDLNEADRDRIFALNTPEAVRGTIANLSSTGAFKDLPPGQTWDEETQWHPGHIGDGRVGKWHDVITDAQAAAINHASRRFRIRFGYDAAPPVGPGTTIDFSATGAGAYYMDEYFSAPEAWGAWTTGDGATVRIGLTHPISSSLRLCMRLSLGPTLTSDTPDATLIVYVNGRDIACLPASTSNPQQLFMTASIDFNNNTCQELVVQFSHPGTKSPAALGLTVDKRALGVGISSFFVEYD